MIHPDLATMLAVVTTDYPLEPGEAIEFLRPAVETTFNAISVDGEPSTNDCVILLANGASGSRGRRRRRGVRAPRSREVCADLARQVVADGEGITVLAEITVTGRRRRRAGEGDRAPDRDLAARQDRALRPRRELGPRADGRRAARRGTAATPTIDAGAGDAALQRHGRPRPRRADRRRAGRLRAELHDRARPRPRRRAAPAT